jgi:hypothetical protein
MPTLTPVDHDPFATGAGMTPVDHDPFAPAPPAAPADFFAPSAGLDRGSMSPGMQGSARGVANLVGMIPELATAAVNLPIAGADAVSGLVGGPDIPFRFPSPTEAIAGAASDVGERFGVTATPYDAFDFNEKLEYNVGDFGTQAGLGLPALLRAAALRAPQLLQGAAPRALDSILRPYMGDSMVKPVAGDVGGVLGGAAGKTVADESGYTDPVSQTGATMGGAVGGASLPGLATTIARAGAKAVGRPFGANVDTEMNRVLGNDPGVPPHLQRPVTKKVSQKATEIVQGAVARPGARDRMLANRGELQGLDPQAPMPTPAQLAEDPGLMALQRQTEMQSQGPAMARQQDFQSSVRDTLDRPVPPGATPEPLIRAAEAEATRRTGAQEARVASAERGGARTQAIREEHGRPIAEARGGEVPASQGLHHEVITEGYLPARAAKNEAFEAVDPERTTQVDAAPVIEAAQRVRTMVNELAPHEAMPTEFTRALERLAPDIQQQPSAILDASGQPITRDVNVGGPGTAALGDLVEVRKYMATATENARKAGNFDLADNINELRAAINQTVEGSPEAAAASQRYGEFADVYRPRGKSEMARTTREIDRTRGPRPSEFASRMIRPNQPETSAELRAAIEAAPNTVAAERAARDYLLADAAKSGVLDSQGALRPASIRRWADRNVANLDLAPGLRDEITTAIGRAGKGERVAGRIAEEIRTRRGDLKTTQDQIDKGALGAVINADPDKAVAAAMGSPRSQRMMRELIDLTANDPGARDGLKAAVREYLINKSTTTAVEKLRPGDRRRPVSFANLTKLFAEHENELADIFNGPGEMNTLRAGHRALELANVERLRVSSGSDTVQKSGVFDKFIQSPIGKAVEGITRIQYGMLKGGGMIAIARRNLAGVGGQSADDISRTVERIMLDPEGMALALGRKVPVGSPAWNRRVHQWLAAGTGARAVNEEDPE